MSRINDVSIMAISKVTGRMYFVDGYKTLPTMRKKYNKLIEALQDRKHDKLMLVARDYDRNIIKVYEEE